MGRRRGRGCWLLHSVRCCFFLLLLLLLLRGCSSGRGGLFSWQQGGWSVLLSLSLLCCQGKLLHLLLQGRITACCWHWRRGLRLHALQRHSLHAAASTCCRVPLQGVLLKAQGRQRWGWGLQHSEVQ